MSGLELINTAKMRISYTQWGKLRQNFPLSQEVSALQKNSWPEHKDNPQTGKNDLITTHLTKT